MNPTLIAWSYGAAALAYAAFALHLRQRERSRRSPRAPALAMLAAAVFAAAWGGLGVAFGLTGIPWLLDVQAGADVLRYGAWYAFLLLPVAPGRGAGARLPAFVAAFVLLGLILQILAAADAAWVADLRRLTLFHALGSAVLALVLLEQLLRSLAPDSLWNAKPLGLGLGGAFLFDLYLHSQALLFNRPDADAFAVRGFAHALVVPLLALSCLRSRDWLAGIRLSQKAAFHSAALLIAGACLLFVAAVGYYVRYFGGEWGRALQLALVFAASLFLLALALSGSMRARLKVLIGKHFFSYRYDYREEWLRYTATLSAPSAWDSRQAMGQQAIRGLADLVESPAGSLWLKDPAQPVFRQAAGWNLPAVPAAEEADSSLCRFLAGHAWVVDLEEFRCHPGRYQALELPAWLPQVPGAWLIVPLLAGGELTGFVVLSRARTALDVNWEVNDLLRTAGRQAASYLAQMQAAEALLEARKFEAFNRMSAFVVHDLKNILTQLSLLLGNARRHCDNPEFQKDMLATVEHAVERMRQLVLQLREGAAPPGTPCGVDLAEVIRRVQSAKCQQGGAVEAQIVDPLVARGDGERLERVIGHVVQNAIDASRRGARVSIRLVRQGGLAKVEVADSGHGMSPDFLRERLFKPFQTTKASGMGIGAYESYQYVKELGGKIVVDSELNKGTRVSMLLPLLEVDELPALRRREAA